MIPRRAFPSLGLALALLLASAGLLLEAATASAQSASPTVQPSPVQTLPAASGRRDEVVQPACENCHGDPAIAQQDPNLYVTETRLHDTVHADLACEACHLPTGGTLHANPEAEIEEAKASCARCHEEVVAEYEASAHGTSPGGPTCTHCHTTHDIQPADNRAFVIAAANYLCADCHDEKGETFFRNNYHGKEANLGRTDIAVCADCHTAHSVLPASDPKSSIAPQNRVETCGKCHQGANQNFANIEIHVDANPIPSDPKLGLATLYFIIILTATFGLFGYHMILSIRHEFRKSRRQPARQEAS